MIRLIRFYKYPRELVGISNYGWRRAVRYFGTENTGHTVAHGFGLLVNWRALWIGAHYSPAHKRLCVNLLPGVTLWWTKPGGQLP